MKKKTLYESPELEIIRFSQKDVLTSSNNIGEDGGENDGEWTDYTSNYPNY